jgi:hypothetical protein
MPTDPLRERRERERKARSAPRQDLLFIVSRDAVDHYVHLKRVFADNGKVTIILDRRWGERRKASSARGVERHSGDRRSRPLIDDRLRRQGWAIVWSSPSTPKTGSIRQP